MGQRPPAAVVRRLLPPGGHCWGGQWPSAVGKSWLLSTSEGKATGQPFYVASGAGVLGPHPAATWGRLETGNLSQQTSGEWPWPLEAGPELVVQEAGGTMGRPFQKPAAAPKAAFTQGSLPQAHPQNQPPRNSPSVGVSLGPRWPHPCLGMTHRGSEVLAGAGSGPSQHPGPGVPAPHGPAGRRERKRL